MYSVLVVDDDTTCLLILKACLKKWNYQVTMVKHALEALSMLRIKSYDLVLADLHMPGMNGFELQQHIHQEFSLPVILISADDKAEVLCMGAKNGAQCFLAKPIVANDLRYIWQYSDWWKKTKNNNTAFIRQINGSSQASLTMANHHNGHDNSINAGDAPSSATRNTARDNLTERRNKKLVWTADLHNRFVEAILVIGYQRAVPTNILAVMNVRGLTRGQVASHLQKYQKFLQRVLDGSKSIESCRWTDFNYHSSFVSGNPNLVLFNQLRDEQRNGKLAAHNPLRPLKQHNTNVNVRAPNGSSLSYQNRPLPPFTEAEASSNRSRNATLMPNNYESSCVNIAAGGLGSATIRNTYNGNMGNIVGSSTTSNSIQNLSYMTNQMVYYNQNTLAQDQNNYARNGGLIGANDNMFLSANNIAPSSTAPLGNNFYSQQSINLGWQDNNNSFNGNNFNSDQLEDVHGDSSIGISFDANQFENTSAMNAQQLDGEEVTDESWLNNSGVTPPDPNLIQGSIHSSFN